MQKNNSQSDYNYIRQISFKRKLIKIRSENNNELYYLKKGDNAN